MIWKDLVDYLHTITAKNILIVGKNRLTQNVVTGI